MDMRCLADELMGKLMALEKLYGQFSVHALCEALDVSRGKFYNHIFRRRIGKNQESLIKSNFPGDNALYFGGHSKLNVQKWICFR